MTPEQQQQAIAQTKTKATTAAKQWESLTPEQKEAMKATWKTDATQAKAKWQSMTPEQRQQAIAELKTKAQTATQTKAASVCPSSPLIIRLRQCGGVAPRLRSELRSNSATTLCEKQCLRP